MRGRILARAARSWSASRIGVAGRDRGPLVHLRVVDGDPQIVLERGSFDADLGAVREWFRVLAASMSGQETLEVVSIRAPIGDRPSVDLRLPGGGLVTLQVGDGFAHSVSFDVPWTWS